MCKICCYLVIEKVYSMSTNCSFRITRSTEDLAKTISLLSQRLISLESRVEQIESFQTQNSTQEFDEQGLMLDSVEQLMKDCRELLEPKKSFNDLNQNWQSEKSDDTFAA